MTALPRLKWHLRLPPRNAVQAVRARNLRPLNRRTKMLAKDMMGVGQAAEFARREGYPGTSAITGAGTTTSDATVLLKSQRVVLAAGASNSGIRLPSDAE